MRKSLFSIIGKKPRPSDNPFNSVMFNDGSQSENGLKMWNFPEKGRKKTEAQTDKQKSRCKIIFGFKIQFDLILQQAWMGKVEFFLNLGKFLGHRKSFFLNSEISEPTFTHRRAVNTSMDTKPARLPTFVYDAERKSDIHSL